MAVKRVQVGVGEHPDTWIGQCGRGLVEMRDCCGLTRLRVLLGIASVVAFAGFTACDKKVPDTAVSESEDGNGTPVNVQQGNTKVQVGKKSVRIRDNSANPEPPAEEVRGSAERSAVQVKQGPGGTQINAGGVQIKTGRPARGTGGSRTKINVGGVKIDVQRAAKDYDLRRD